MYVVFPATAPLQDAGFRAVTWFILNTAWYTVGTQYMFSND